MSTPIDLTGPTPPPESSGTAQHGQPMDMDIIRVGPSSSGKKSSSKPRPALKRRLSAPTLGTALYKEGKGESWVRDRTSVIRFHQGKPVSSTTKFAPVIPLPAPTSLFPTTTMSALTKPHAAMKDSKEKKAVEKKTVEKKTHVKAKAGPSTPKKTSVTKKDTTIKSKPATQPRKKAKTRATEPDPDPELSEAEFKEKRLSYLMETFCATVSALSAEFGGIPDYLDVVEDRFNQGQVTAVLRNSNGEDWKVPADELPGPSNTQSSPPQYTFEDGEMRLTDMENIWQDPANISKILDSLKNAPLGSIAKDKSVDGLAEELQVAKNRVSLSARQWDIVKDCLTIVHYMNDFSSLTEPMYGEARASMIRQFGYAHSIEAMKASKKQVMSYRQQSGMHAIAPTAKQYLNKSKEARACGEGAVWKKPVIDEDAKVLFAADFKDPSKQASGQLEGIEVMVPSNFNAAKEGPQMGKFTTDRNLTAQNFSNGGGRISDRNGVNVDEPSNIVQSALERNRRVPRDMMHFNSQANGNFYSAAALVAKDRTGTAIVVDLTDDDSETEQEDLPTTRGMHPSLLPKAFMSSPKSGRVGGSIARHPFRNLISVSLKAYESAPINAEAQPVEPVRSTSGAELAALIASSSTSDAQQPTRSMTGPRVTKFVPEKRSVTPLPGPVSTEPATQGGAPRGPSDYQVWEQQRNEEKKSTNGEKRRHNALARFEGRDASAEEEIPFDMGY